MQFSQPALILLNGSH